MIAWLTGAGLPLDSGRLLVTNAITGVGYEVRVPHTHLLPMDLMKVELFIWHVIREDDQELFGFWALADRQLAKLIGETQGVGPTTASRLVQEGGHDPVIVAIAQGDAKMLSKLMKGLGPKRAEQIIHQLKEYAEEQMHSAPGMQRIPEHRRTVVERALVALGFVVDKPELMKVLEDNLQLDDHQVVRAYIQQVVVRT